MAALFIVGMGPGSGQYLLPVAEQAILDADIIVGAPRHVEAYRGRGQEVIEIRGNMDETLEHLRKHLGGEKRGALLVSGDPMFFSLMRKVRELFDRDEYEIIPGISSFQVACCRADIMWENAAFLSVHGRSMESLKSLLHEKRPVIILTDNRHNPAEIARYCLNFEKGKRKVWVGKNLSYRDEVMYRTTLEELAQREERGLCVMIIEESS
ncbi:MAG: precorrin-6y C5,15-methyltransferase (decarboxylating) subunit CbiE [Spirochaetes bacterium]|nr:MAG: precorrin-6y C5,15-methyltransferase (decarboxylating) subunit CbiE [Spirochaetota bacterium]